MTGFPASTSGVELMIANDPLRTLVFGKLPRFTRFRMLKISQRASIRVPPETWNDFRRFTSNCASPGNRAELRPHVPNLPAAGVPKAADAFVMNGRVVSGSG